MDPRARIAELAKIMRTAAPVVSVYLNTRWADEQQRERVRVFLKNEIRKASRGAGHQDLSSDLDWIQAQGESLIEQTRFPEANGVALFACRALGLREVLPVRVPFENVFVVADAPFLSPLVAALPEIPATLVVFVAGESARLIPLGPEGVGEEVRLESEVPGHHRRGGWAQLAQSRYQRHIQEHRGRHFEAVAAALLDLTEGNGVERIVMAGEPRTVTAFRKHVPPRIVERIAGIISGTQHEPASALLTRAAEVLARLSSDGKASAVEAVLTEAAKSGRAVAGVEETLEAVGRGAVHRLYLLKGFNQRGGACVECGALQLSESATCLRCGSEARRAEFGETLVDRVIATGGKVEVIEVNDGLARVGGVAALLRYPL